MKINQFRYNSDNLAYLIHHDGVAMSVDGGAVTAITSFLAEHGLTLETIAHTHGHGDHTQGTTELARATGATPVDHRALADGQTLSLGAERIIVLRTPGHTEDSICFVAGGALIAGDTLFNGTVGNCFSGDLEAFYRSICRLMALPPETRIFAGHDYVRDSMAFARWIEPENERIQAYLAAYDPHWVVSTLADELAVNPYLRFNAPSVIAALEKKGLPVDSESRRWQSLMTL